MRRNGMTLTIAWFALLALPAADAGAEQVRGPETCTSGSYARTIGGKKFVCATKCTTTVTTTTCNPNCSTTVVNEVRYQDCMAETATKPPTRNYGVKPPHGILETDSGGWGGGGPGPAGQPVRPPAPRPPVLR